MVYRYIFDMELLGFCDEISIKGVKWVFRYLGNLKRRSKTRFFLIRFKNKFQNIYFKDSWEFEKKKTY